MAYAAVHPALAVGVGADPGVSNGVRAGYHLAAIFWLPESLGWTPSTVSVASLNPVHWSTTTIGDCAVLSDAAQAGMAASRLTTPCAQLEHPLGFIGMICATRIFMFGLFARICCTSVV